MKSRQFKLRSVSLLDPAAVALEFSLVYTRASRLCSVEQTYHHSTNLHSFLPFLYGVAVMDDPPPLFLITVFAMDFDCRMPHQPSIYPSLGPASTKASPPQVAMLNGMSHHSKQPNNTVYTRMIHHGTIICRYTYKLFVFASLL